MSLLQRGILMINPEKTFVLTVSRHLLKQTFPLSHRKALRDQSALLRINNLITSSYQKHNERKFVKNHLHVTMLE